MAEYTLAELDAMISIINSAISELAQGKRRKSLTVGSREFMRTTQFDGLTYAQLLAERTRLHNLKVILYPEQVTLKFKGNTNFPLLVSNKPV